ncbi:signal peptidase I [Microbacterium sp.]|uniref:signal peptidase I n=1 Tax=Microbacterium sp. TaxID=51671 RepID=UPI003A898BF7
MRTVASFVGRTAAWIVILAAVTVIVVAVLIPRIAGATPYTILTGSMQPAYPPGTLVVVRPVDDTDDLSVGDVVTVQLESGEETVVTHRIVEIQHRADSQTQFITKGDANDVPDAEPRMPVQVRGEVWYSIPYLGYISTALTGSQRSWLVTAIAVGLIGYAAWMFTGAWRERRRRAGAKPAEQAVGDERDQTTDPKDHSLDTE